MLYEIRPIAISVGKLWGRDEINYGCAAFPDYATRRTYKKNRNFNYCMHCFYSITFSPLSQVTLTRQWLFCSIKVPLVFWIPFFVWCGPYTDKCMYVGQHHSWYKPQIQTERVELCLGGIPSIIIRAKKKQRDSIHISVIQLFGSMLENAQMSTNLNISPSWAAAVPMKNKV